MMPVFIFSNPVIDQSVPGGKHIVTLSVPIDACLYFHQPCHRSVCTRSTHCYVNLFLMMPVFTFSNPVIGQSVPGVHIVM